MEIIERDEDLLPMAWTIALQTGFWHTQHRDRFGAHLAMSMLSFVVFADAFTSVRYDSGADQLVISMAYRGTNPNHTFSLKCKDTPGSRIRQIAVQVLDSQWQDRPLKDFKKTTRFSLADFRCRPANVTLITAPRFHSILLIPAARVPPQ